MAGGKGGLKKKVRKPAAVASAEQTPKAPRKAKSKPSAAGAGSSVASAAPGPMELDEKTTASLKKQTACSRGKGSSAKPGAVLYLGHIPHGFYEEEMMGFFSQFGDVKRLRLSRNKKTGASKHFAFIEFEVAQVAAIVAKSMNGYLMYNKILVCHVMAPEAIHAGLFAKSAKLPSSAAENRLRERKRHNAPKDEKAEAARQERLKSADEKKRKKLAAAGIEYDFEGYAGAAAKKEGKKVKKAKTS